ncbi:MAG: hypothetical protein PQJ46_01205 [Spirochaetales bacterium]|nr:hypothetical protein [Spirochaetales bacterium]
MKLKSFILILQIIIIFTPWQNLLAENTENNQNSKVFILNNIEWDITGRSKPARLLYAADIDRNEKWNNIEELDFWIKDKRQLLINQRELKAVDVIYSLQEEEQDILVNLKITITDSMNIIALPKPEYSSSDGLDLSIRARDYNFLGLLTPLRINLGYAAEPEAISSLDLLNASWYSEISLSIPFKVNIIDFEYSFTQDFEYTDDSVFQSSTVNEITGSIDTKIGTFSSTLSEGCYYNAENGDEYKAEYGNYLEGWYFNTTASASYSKDLIEFKKLGTSLSAGASLGINFNYLPNLTYIGAERAGPTLTPSTSLSTGRIDWIDNLREGYSLSLSTSFPYDFYKSELNPVFSTTAIYHHRFCSWFGLSGNLFAMYRPSSKLSSADDYIRGITSLQSSAGLFLNIDAPFLIQFYPDKLFGWSWAHFLSFDLHIAPFIDFALSYNREDKNYDKYKPYYFCPGIEAIIYPKIFRSLFLRVSVGFDYRDFPSSHELYIGLSHQY